MNVPLKRILPLFILLAALALLAACGDEDAETTSGAVESDDSALDSDATPTEVFTSFQGALASGDAEAACAALAPSAIEQVEAASIGGTCDDWVAEIASILDPASQANLDATKVEDEKIDGTDAVLAYTDPIVEIPLEVELIELDGSWLISKLSAFV